MLCCWIKATPIKKDNPPVKIINLLTYFWPETKIEEEIKDEKSIMLIKDPLKYEPKQIIAVVGDNVLNPIAAREWDPPAIPWNNPKNVNAWECLLCFFCFLLWKCKCSWAIPFLCLYLLFLLTILFLVVKN